MNENNISNTFNSKLPLPSGYHPNPDDIIYTDTEFLNIIDRECIRSDVYQNPFSLVVFSLGQDANECKNLLDVLVKRLRLSDAAGWINANNLGILLFDTDTDENVQTFICSLLDLLTPATQKALPEPKVHFYPRDWQSQRSAIHWQVQPVQTERRTPQIDLADEYNIIMKGSLPKLEKLMVHAMPFWKRSMDILGASFAILLFFPLLVGIAIAIKISSPGPIFFRQSRAGYLGRSFTIWKFRTMKVDVDTSQHQRYVNDLLKNGKPMYKLEDKDPQVIPFGNVLRKAGLDEVPQLINVLKGEMSLVGPRPDVFYAVDNYKEWHHARGGAYPGITGLWQVKGKNNTSYDRMMSLDIKYARNLSLWLDVKIIIKTPVSILMQIKDAIFSPQDPLKQNDTKTD